MTSHRARLEDKLLAEYDRVHPLRQTRLRRTRPRWTAALAALALGAGLLFAARAPAEYAAELAQRIEVRAPPGSELPKGAAMQELVAQGLGAETARRREIELRRIRDGRGELLQIDVWGAPVAGVVERLRARVPRLGRAEIAVRPLSGRVHTNLLGLVAMRVLGTRGDPQAVAEARRALQAELDAEGGGTSDLQVEVGPDGRRRVRVEVKQIEEKK